MTTHNEPRKPYRVDAHKNSADSSIVDSNNKYVWIETRLDTARRVCDMLNEAHAAALRPFIEAGLATPDGEPRKVLGHGERPTTSLPLTADGSIALANACVVYHPNHPISGDVASYCEAEGWAAEFYEELEDGGAWAFATVPLIECYSTREAALAALQTPPAAPSGEVEG